ncbi:hypothetical protein KIN20_022915 [Parelaphostrongylus tenuis]|uniref:Uncharacterized protein n=1 Tax=Parelaphostrongylus tenuis TaxID=148309 RepID=A0AAD5QSL9_PARTN|nr:hypothetical protein KIN20_022915 [Parelaphostrongylus tenuis]
MIASSLFLRGSIMLGLMLGTASLSMFISNTATTAMMVPLMQSLINELLSCYDTKSAREEDRKACKDMSIGMALSICYASNIGGTGTLTGTPTNLVLVGQVVELFGSEAEVDYVTWFLFAFPLMCICMVAIWLVLVAMYLRNAPKNERVTALMRQKYEDQAVISFAEKSVAVAFGVLLVLWIFRDPGLFKGYGALLPKNHYTDTTSAMIIALLLFALPSEKPDFSDCAKKEIKEVPRLMDWNTVQKTLSLGRCSFARWWICSSCWREGLWFGKNDWQLSVERR